jgi:dihydrofolate reductase
MKIRTRMCMSADGYVTTPDGWPAQLAYDSWDPVAFGFGELQARCDAVLMGRTTFEPALGAEKWPWPGLDVFVLGSRRPSGTPEHVVVDGDPVRLLEQLRAVNRGGDVHLVGGPRTIEAFRRLGELDELGLIVLPLLLGGGMQLTPSVSTDAALTLERAQSLDVGVVEIAYSFRG